MAEEVKAVHREPHPFIGIQQIMNFVGKPVAFVGRIDRFEDNTMFMKTHEGKYQTNIFLHIRLESAIFSSLKNAIEVFPAMTLTVDIFSGQE